MRANVYAAARRASPIKIAGKEVARRRLINARRPDAIIPLRQSTFDINATLSRLCRAAFGAAAA